MTGSVPKDLIDVGEITEEGIVLFVDDPDGTLKRRLEDGHAAIEEMQPDLAKAARISRSLSAVAALRYGLDKLRNLKIEGTIEYIYELEALTTAFVVQYVRLHQGGAGSGFARNDLPEDLRAKHDEIIELRNTRFAHDDRDADFITDNMDVALDGKRFIIHRSLNIRIQFNGSPEWTRLVEYIEELLLGRSYAVLDRMNAKSEYEWTYAEKPE